MTCREAFPAEIDYGRMIRALNAVHYAGETAFYGTAPLRPAEEVLLDGLSAGTRVLDVGCGAGRVTVPLAADGHAAVGVDVNRPALSAARSHAPELPVLSSTMAALPFASESFDEVWCLRFSFNALPTEDERRETIRELWRVCTPGGRVLVEAFNWHCAGRYGLLRLANLLDALARSLRWLGQGRTGSVPLPSRDILYLANKASGAAPGYAHLTTTRELRQLVNEAGIVGQHVHLTDEAGLRPGAFTAVRNRHRGYATWLALRKSPVRQLKGAS